MRFEKSIDIDAPQERVWRVLTNIDAWPTWTPTVEAVQILTPGALAVGSRVRLKQPKLPEGIWDVTRLDTPSYFEWRQKTAGITSVAGHRVEATGEGRSRLTLTLDMRGLAVVMVALFYKGMTNRYMQTEAEGLKRASEGSA